MPLNIDFVQVLLHLLNFVILAGGLTILVYKPVMKFLDARRAKFEALAEQNQAAKEESDRLQQAYASRLADAEAEIAEQRQKTPPGPRPPPSSPTPKRRRRRAAPRSWTAPRPRSASWSSRPPRSF